MNDNIHQYIAYKTPQAVDKALDKIELSNDDDDADDYERLQASIYKDAIFTDRKEIQNEL